MIDLYSVNLGRNKSSYKNQSTNILKKSIYKGICEICKNKFKVSQLELEHTIPIRVGGAIFLKSNLKLYCPRCHNKKTGIDIRTINVLKKIGLFDNHQFYINPDQVIKEFIRIRKLIKKCKVIYETWDYGKNGIDYQQIRYIKNREVEDGEKRIN